MKDKIYRPSETRIYKFIAFEASNVRWTLTNWELLKIQKKSHKRQSKVKEKNTKALWVA